MATQQKTSRQRIFDAGRDERRVSNRSETMSPFGGVFNALRPLIQ